MKRLTSGLFDVTFSQWNSHYCGYNVKSVAPTDLQNHDPTPRVIKPPDGPRKTILVVDDHPVVRDGLKMLLDRETDLEVCSTAKDCVEALEAVERFNPDLVLTDLSMQGDGGMDLVKALRNTHPRLPILVLSVHDEAIYAERALRAGARGYIMKREATHCLLSAIRRLLNGQIYLSDEEAHRVLERVLRKRDVEREHELDLLSDKELEVFQCIGRGLNTREIAAQLGRSTKTVDSHRSHIMEKLKIKSTAQLVRFASQWDSGVADPGLGRAQGASN